MAMNDPMPMPSDVTQTKVKPGDSRQRARRMDQVAFALPSASRARSKARQSACFPMQVSCGVQAAQLENGLAARLVPRQAAAARFASVSSSRWAANSSSKSRSSVLRRRPRPAARALPDHVANHRPVLLPMSPGRGRSPRPAVPSCRFLAERLLAGAGQRVVLRPPVVLRRAPGGLDQPAMLQAKSDA